MFFRVSESLWLWVWVCVCSEPYETALQILWNVTRPHAKHTHTHAHTHARARTHTHTNIMVYYDISLRKKNTNHTRAQFERKKIAAICSTHSCFLFSSLTTCRVRCAGTVSVPGAQPLAFFFYLGNRMRCAGQCILTEGGAQEPLHISLLVQKDNTALLVQKYKY